MRYLLATILCFSSSLDAEIWRCDQNVYTNIQNTAADCSPLRNQVVCGREGNKYYSPYRPGTKDSNSCSSVPVTDNQTSSPLVNMRFVEAYKGYKPEPTKKFAEKAPLATQLSSEMGMPGLDNLPDILQMIQSAGSQIDNAMR